MRSLVAFSLVVLLSSGCAVGPNYKRPNVSVPDTYRGATPQEATQPAAESLGDQKWWELFQDQQLQDLIHTALRQNYNVWIAASRILEAQAQVGITRADGLPTINAGAQSFDQRSPRSKLFHEYDTSAHQVDLSLELVYSGDFTVYALAQAVCLKKAMKEAIKEAEPEYESLLREIEDLSDEEAAALGAPDEELVGDLVQQREPSMHVDPLLGRRLPPFDRGPDDAFAANGERGVAVGARARLTLPELLQLLGLHPDLKNIQHQHLTGCAARKPHLA